ncbi:MAG: FHA domain-containing protein, partial [Myxococcota bacterium]|nr:FHA domain-containing protein [Myxococcota bacterium]
MFSVVIEEKAGATTVKEFQSDEVTIGRVQGNDIILPKSNISKRHARIINKGGAFVVIDSKSTNGTYINGQRIDAPFDVNLEDKIYIGDFTLQIQSEADAEDEIAEDEIFEEPTQSEIEKSEEISEDEVSLTSQSDDDLWDDEEDEDVADVDEVPAKAAAASEEAEDDFDHEINDEDDEWDDSWEIAETPDGNQAEKSAAEDIPELSSQDINALDDVPHLGTDAEEAPHPPTMPMQAHKAKADAEPEEVDLASELEPEIEPEPEIEAEAEQAPSQHANLSEEHSQALALVHERLLRSLDLRRLNLEEMNDAELRERTQAAVQEIVSAMAQEDEIPEGIDSEHLVESVLDEALGLGPLESLLQDDSINEIMVNGAKQIY